MMTTPPGILSAILGRFGGRPPMMGQPQPNQMGGQGPGQIGGVAPGSQGNHMGASATIPGAFRPSATGAMPGAQRPMPSFRPPISIDPGHAPGGGIGMGGFNPQIFTEMMRPQPGGITSGGFNPQQLGGQASGILGPMFGQMPPRPQAPAPQAGPAAVPQRKFPPGMTVNGRSSY